MAFIFIAINSINVASAEASGLIPVNSAPPARRYPRPYRAHSASGAVLTSEVSMPRQTLTCTTAFGGTGWRRRPTVHGRSLPLAQVRHRRQCPGTRKIADATIHFPVDSDRRPGRQCAPCRPSRAAQLIVPVRWREKAGWSPSFSTLRSTMRRCLRAVPMPASFSRQSRCGRFWLAADLVGPGATAPSIAACRFKPRRWTSCGRSSASAPVSVRRALWPSIVCRSVVLPTRIDAGACANILDPARRCLASTRRYVALAQVTSPK